MYSMTTNQDSLAEQKRNGQHGKFGTKSTSAPTAGLGGHVTPPEKPHIARLRLVAAQQRRVAAEAQKAACAAEELEVSARIREVAPDAVSLTVIRNFEEDSSGFGPYIESEVAIEHTDGSYSIFDGQELTGGRDLSALEAQDMRTALNQVRFLADDDHSDVDYTDIEDFDGHPFATDAYKDNWGEMAPMCRMDISDAPSSALDTLERYRTRLDTHTRGVLMADAIRDRAQLLAPNAERLLFTREHEPDGSSRLEVAGVEVGGSFYDIAYADAIRKPDAVWSRDDLNEAYQITIDINTYQSDDDGALNIAGLERLDGDDEHLFALPLQ